MVDRLAIKVLSNSDLTFFDAIYKSSNVGNQKSINLNADIFTKKFYPSLGEKAVGSGIEVSVQVVVFGPSQFGAYQFSRSITKGARYKNWRLNGAAVPDPESEPGRFSTLQQNDIAVMEFTGEPAPQSVRLVVVSNTSDPKLVEKLATKVPGGKRTMASVTRAELREYADEASAAPDHPIRLLAEDLELEAQLEDASFGSEVEVKKLRAKAGRSISKAEIEAGRVAAERIGADGEAIAFLQLSQLVNSGEFADLLWASEKDAASSWDFLATTADGSGIRFDAKSTKGAFERPIHMSGAEVAAAAEPNTRYRIIRVYNLSEDGASTRISHDINAVAEAIKTACSGLPSGVRPGNFTMDPGIFDWEKEMTIDRPDEPE